MGLASKLQAIQGPNGQGLGGAGAGAGAGYGGAPSIPGNRPPAGNYPPQQQFPQQYPQQQHQQYPPQGQGHPGQPPYPQGGPPPYAQIQHQGQPGYPQGQQGGYPQGQQQGQQGHNYGPALGVAAGAAALGGAGYAYHQYQQHQGPPQGQGQYGGPQGVPQGGPQGGLPQGNVNQYLQSLQRAVQENGIQGFYPPQRLEQIAQAMPSIVPQLVQAWQIPFEIGVDLVRLALYDIVLYVDDSGSMSFEENGERIEDLKLLLNRTAFAASLFDPNGIEVRFMNSDAGGNNIRSEQQVAQMVQRVRFQGLTPLGTSLKKKVLDPLVVGPARSNGLNKPVLVITITDGHPAGERSGTLQSAISDAKRQVSRTRYGPGALALQFAQVGNDLKAREFLQKLDSDPEVGNMVDCTSTFEVEQDEMARLGVDLTPSLWIVKLLVGAIDRSYDNQDERRRR